MKYLFLLLPLLFCSCSPATTPPNSHWVEIAGRSDTTPLYQIFVPSAWQQVTLMGNRDDTTLPIAEFSIDDKVRITIHNFPAISDEKRIPPTAQIARWKRQFDQLDPISVQIIPQAFSGYAGLMFEASGIQNGQETCVLGWTMQLAPEFFRQPLSADTRGDFTIKIVGNPNLIRAEKKRIIAFARSFELIHPLHLPS